MTGTGTRDGPTDALRVAAIQMEHLSGLDANLEEAERLLAAAQQAGAVLAVLPEYFFSSLSGEAETDAAAVRSFLARTSKELGIAIAANLIEETQRGRHNIGVVYDAGTERLAQPKVHPMPREIEYGLSGGDGFKVAEVRGQPLGMLVCSDILYPEAARILALLGARLLLNPVMSPYRTEDADRTAREAMYIARAYDSGAFVIKAGGYRHGDPHIVGRSLIAAPWGIVAHYAEGFASEVLVADLDLVQLDRFRTAQTRFPQRRPEVYGALTQPRQNEGGGSV